MSKRNTKAEASGLVPLAKRGKRRMPKVEQFVPPTKIGMLAREVADLRDAHSKMFEAEEVLCASEKRHEEADGPRHDDALMLPKLKQMKDEVWDLGDVFEAYIAYLEPDSMEDVATLALLLSEAVNNFECDYARPEFCGDDEDDPRRQYLLRNQPQPDDEAKRKFERDRRRLYMLMRKIERCLHELAPSPLHRHLGFGGESVWAELAEILPMAERVIAEEAKAKKAA
jgi:hypothetical protein